MSIMTPFNHKKMEGAGGANRIPNDGNTCTEGPGHNVGLEDGIFVGMSDSDMQAYRRRIVEEVGLTSPLTALLFLRGELDVKDIGAANHVAELRSLSMMGPFVR